MTIKFDYASSYFVTKVTICDKCFGFGILNADGSNNVETWEDLDREVIDCPDCDGEGSITKQVPLDIALSELGVKLPDDEVQS